MIIRKAVISFVSRIYVCLFVFYVSVFFSNSIFDENGNTDNKMALFFILYQELPSGGFSEINK